MAEKEYLLGNKARELLKYTNQATKIVTDDVRQSDVRKIIQKIAEQDDITRVKATCADIVGYLDRKDKEGFSKNTYRCYGEDMRKLAKGIVVKIKAANGKLFAVEHADRLRLIGEVIDDCEGLLEFIQIVHDNGVIDTRKMGVWTKKVTDVEYMAKSWKKKDGAREKELLEKERDAEDEHRIMLMVAALRRSGIFIVREAEKEPAEEPVGKT